MKKILLYTSLIFLTALLTECGKTKSNFTIKGTFEIPVETTIYLGKLDISEVIPVDSMQCGPEGVFKLKGYEKQPGLYVVSFERNSIYLVVKPHEKISIEINNAISPFDYHVEGSTDSRLVRDLVFQQGKVLTEIKNISVDYENSKDDPETFVTKKPVFDSLYDNLMMLHKSFTTDFIHKNSTSLACIFALYQNFGVKSQPLYDKFEDIDVFNFVDSNLTPLYPKTPAVVALNRDVTDIKEQIKFKTYSENLFRPGRRAPDFSAVSIDTIPVNLAALRGKAVVLVFFASWNKISSVEAVCVNELSRNYKARGLEVIGISFDKSEQMLQQFIDTNHIEFPVICDYAYWDSKFVSQFGIRSIPEIILLDKNHIVIQRDIKCNELQATLEEWRKNRLL